MRTLQRSLIVSIGVAALFAIAAGPGQAQRADHMQCFKIKDERLKAFADINSEQFGLDEGCKIGKARFFCVPATKTDVSIDTLDYMTGVNPGARICYNAKCKGSSAPDTMAADQFGSRSLKLDSSRLLCTPATTLVFPGFLGRVEVPTPVPGHDGDQYWTDTDGVAPEVPGCHIAYAGQRVSGMCSDSLEPAGVFGELCIPPGGLGGFPEGALIESNPGKDVCHAHRDNFGHPDVYDCGEYCKGTYPDRPIGKCVTVADQCEGLDGDGKPALLSSAKCECTAS